MKMNLSNILFVIIHVVIADGIILTSEVETDKGLVQGKILATVLNEMVYAAFLGIPYAEPPVATRRFQPPVENDGWSDILNATIEGSMCIQYNSTSLSVVGSENCLYLNVFTPHIEFNETISKPVMVWIHGGIYTTGNSNASNFGPDFLIEEDVIIVTFNYRLSALGFLNLEHDDAFGNCGLKDQNMALKWVQRNIANFGGDPKRVTLFGQSAGAVSVDLQVLSDMSVGLFQKTISLSGSTLCFYWGFQTQREALEQAFNLGTRLGIKTSDKNVLLQALLNVSAVDIIIAANKLKLIPFRPTLESESIAKGKKKFLTTCSVKKYSTGNYTKGPHIMGFTSDETVSFGSSVSQLINFAKQTLNSVDTESILFLDNLLDVTKKGVTSLTDDGLYDVIQVTSDIFFFTGIDTKQQMMSLNNDHPIYYYRFAFDSNYSDHRSQGVDIDGVGHEDDLPYLFYRPVLQIPLYEPDIAKTRDRMVRLLTNFAKYGNPTPNGLDDELLGIDWIESGIRGIHLEINRNLSMGPRPISRTVEILKATGLGNSSIVNNCSESNPPDILSNVNRIILYPFRKILSVTNFIRNILGR